MTFKEIQNATSYLTSVDEKLGNIITSAGKCELRPHKNYYISLLESIIGQQLSMKAANAIISKFLNHFDNNPAPERIIEDSTENLRSLGLSFAKIKYVKDLSKHILERKIDFGTIDDMSDIEIIEYLVQVKGIGEWTAHMFLIFTLGRPDVLPTGDLGLKKAIKNTYNLRNLPSPDKVRLISKKKKWGPYNSVAAWYLWKSLEL